MLPSIAATELVARAEAWQLAEPFVISRGSRTETRVVVVEAHADGEIGRGECTPYPRYGETIDGVLALIAAIKSPVDIVGLHDALPPGAARNAIDCALWDLAAKSSGGTVHELIGCPPPVPVTTCFTLSLASPEAMAAKARAVPHLPLLKMKLGGDGDAARMRAVRAARHDARLVADANEAWLPAETAALLSVAAECRLEMVEQPLPVDRDAVLATISRPLPVCADESAHTCAGIAALGDRYDAVNIKLDKAGGLTEALAMAEEAERRGMAIMIGCMLATSLAMAPAMLMTRRARWVDLDAPLLLARDRVEGLVYRHGVIEPAKPALWG